MRIIEKARKIFRENYIGSLATANQDGSPWSTPVHVVADEDYVYWLSTPDKQHSQNIARDNRTHLTLFSPEVERGLQGVYIAGQAEQLADSQQPSIYQLMLERVGAKNLPAGMENSAAYRLPLGRLNKQRSSGNCWYFYS